jgi:hypothetical protein
MQFNSQQTNTSPHLTTKIRTSAPPTTTRPTSFLSKVKQGAELKPEHQT